MNILIIGSGAREHAIAMALHRSTQHPVLFCLGTTMNPGIKQMTSHYRVVSITDVNTIVALAKEWNINIAMIGPEAPLEKGVADALWEVGIATIGPKQAQARIETSKQFGRELMLKYAIPGLPLFKSFTEMRGIAEFLQQLGEGQYVVKANGLMGGKGVKVAGDHLHSIEEALQFCQEIFASGQTCIIEQKLVGQEFSFMGLCDGEHIIPMPIVQDHKRAYVGDKGPNTGGMGSYSDVNHRLPFLSDTEVEAAWQINEAVFRALNTETQEKYIGILYGSFIATRHGVYVIEFNARFGDPEALNVLTILQSDFVSICQAMISGTLTSTMVRFANQATVCKYAVPEGYPDEPIKNVEIDIAAVKNKTRLYLAAVDFTEGKMLATGSRTAAYVGVANSITAAEEISEREIRCVDGPLFHREDIGTLQLIQKRINEMKQLREV